MKLQGSGLLRPLFAGLCGGAVNGLFGTGGGLAVVPLLRGKVDKQRLFPTAVGVILPLCLVSLAVYALRDGLPLSQALPYLLGGSIGGVLAGLFCRKIPTALLRRVFALFLLWGGVRLLW